MNPELNRRLRNKPKLDGIRDWVQEKALSKTKSETETEHTGFTIKICASHIFEKSPYYLILKLRVAENSILNGHTH